MALATPCWGCWEELGSTWTWGTVSRESGVGLQGGRAELGECHQLFRGAGEQPGGWSGVNAAGFSVGLGVHTGGMGLAVGQTLTVVPPFF